MPAQYRLGTLSTTVSTASPMPPTSRFGPYRCAAATKAIRDVVMSVDLSR
jgi:hypothetical protein